MSNTIAFVAKPAGAYYTIAEINAFFEDVAAVLNAKVDVDQPSVLGLPLNLGDVAVINVADGVEASDAATYGQALAYVDE